MAALQSDRLLRHMVARLVKMQPDDMESILSQLNEEQKSRILALLKEFEGSSRLQNKIDAPARVDSGTIIIPDHVSPWLADRMRGHSVHEEHAGGAFAITPHAQASLRRCAEIGVPLVATAQHSPSLLERLWGKFT
jgi:hypothetical protein